jgi:hypothetical protein
VGAQTFFSGASTDVVSHEVGHGLLDSMRPDFFGVNFLEVGAFHEAFGDCIAILTALSDTETRQRLLAVAPNLRARDFVESTAEQLSRAIGLAIPGHNAAEPRHAFNTFKFQIPSTLPDDGGPGALINEVHSFGELGALRRSARQCHRGCHHRVGAQQDVMARKGIVDVLAVGPAIYVLVGQDHRPADRLQETRPHYRTPYPLDQDLAGQLRCG